MPSTVGVTNHRYAYSTLQEWQNNVSLRHVIASPDAFLINVVFLRIETTDIFANDAVTRSLALLQMICVFAIIPPSCEECGTEYAHRPA